MKPDDAHPAGGSRPTCLCQTAIEQHGRHVILILAIQFKRLDGRRLLLSPDGHDRIVRARPEPKANLVTVIGKAYHWQQELEQHHLTLGDLADRLEISTSHIRKLLPLIHLSPGSRTGRGRATSRRA